MPLCSPVSPWLLGLVRAPENLKCKIQLKCQRIVNVILHQWILKVVASKAFQNRFTQQSVQKSIYHDSVYKLAENGKFLHLLIVNWIATVLEISQRFGLHHHSVHLDAIFHISTHLEHKCLVDPAIKAWLTLYHHTGVALGEESHYQLSTCQLDVRERINNRNVRKIYTFSIMLWINCLKQ